MKKLLSCLLLISLLLTLPSCGDKEDPAELSIVAVNFAAYDFAREIVGRDNDRVSVCLLQRGDVHSADFSASDILKIEHADLFLYVGGESDADIDKLLAPLTDVTAFRLVDCVSLLTEDELHGDEPSHDEHVWTSPKNAITIVSKLADAIAAVDDTAYAASYHENAAAYTEKLSLLDTDFETLFKGQTKPIIFADRFPLLYFAKEYDMDYASAFPSCHASSEPSFSKRQELTALAKETGVTYIFHIEGGSHAVADSLAADIGGKTALFHSCHTVGEEELKNGATYLSLMTQNCETLKAALAD